MLIYVTAFALGILHAFGPDHLAAVSTFVSHRRRRLPALGVSLRWGMGHLLSVLLFGVLVAALAVHIPERFEAFAEFGAGLVLVLVGLLSLRRSFRARRLHYHRHRHGTVVHAHLHTHAHSEEHFDGHAATLTGAVHGLAGAAPALALTPLAAMNSPWVMGAYLLLFGLGVTLGMAAYCLALGGVLQRIPQLTLERWVQPLIASGSCALGVVWMARTGLLFPM